MPELVDCPECGLPAEVLDRFVLESTHGPVEHVKTHCAARHHLTFPAVLLEVI
jgi:hypothetical protein